MNKILLQASVCIMTIVLPQLLMANTNVKTEKCESYLRAQGFWARWSQDSYQFKTLANNQNFEGQIDIFLRIRGDAQFTFNIFKELAPEADIKSAKNAFSEIRHKLLHDTTLFSYDYAKAFLEKIESSTHQIAHQAHAQSCDETVPFKVLELTPVYLLD